MTINCIPSLHMYIYITGVDATTLPQYTSTLSSMTLYIASINTTDSSLRGKWRLVLQSRGAYSIQVMATSDLTFSLTLFQRDSTNDYGVSEVNGKSLEGQFHCIMIYMDCKKRLM